MGILMGYNTQLETATQALNRAEQDKTFAETMLSQQLEAWRSGSNGGGEPVSLRAQLAQAQANLNTLESRYTTDHPDVVKARQAVADLKKKLDAANDDTAKADTEKPKRGSGTEPANIAQIRTAIHNLDQEIATRKQQQQQLQHRIAEYQAKVAQAPMVEEESKALNRDYQMASMVYNDLLGKKSQSEMTTDMERRQQGETFRVMDPANLPEKPSFPNRILFTAGGAFGGLGIGFGIAFLKELRDKSLRTEQDIEFYLELPTLAQLPVVGRINPTNGNKGHWWQRNKGKKQAAAVVEAETEVQTEHGVEA